MSGRDPYLLPGSNVLRNKLGITDPGELDYNEREIVMQRIREGVPSGDFDLSHLQTIHRHLFQDIYDWAGEIRTLEISKGGNQFQFRQYIETGMKDVHGRLVKSDFLRGLGPDAFAKGAGAIMGDINYVHPFREGNGRTQLQYLRLLGAQAGYKVRIDQLDPAAWLDASRAAHRADYGPMSAEIGRVLEPQRQRETGEAERDAPARQKPRFVYRSKERDDDLER